MDRVLEFFTAEKTKKKPPLYVENFAFYDVDADEQMFPGAKSAVKVSASSAVRTIATETWRLIEEPNDLEPQTS